MFEEDQNRKPSGSDWWSGQDWTRLPRWPFLSSSGVAGPRAESQLSGSLPGCYCWPQQGCLLVLIRFYCLDYYYYVIFCFKLKVRCVIFNVPRDILSMWDFSICTRLSKNLQKILVMWRAALCKVQHLLKRTWGPELKLEDTSARKLMLAVNMVNYAKPTLTESQPWEELFSRMMLHKIHNSWYLPCVLIRKVPNWCRLCTTLHLSFKCFFFSFEYYISKLTFHRLAVVRHCTCWNTSV